MTEQVKSHGASAVANKSWLIVNGVDNVGGRNDWSDGAEDANDSVGWTMVDDSSGSEASCGENNNGTHLLLSSLARNESNFGEGVGLH